MAPPLIIPAWAPAVAPRRLRWMDRWAPVTGYTPHAGQLAAHRDRRRNRIIAKGRRGGGTTAADFEVQVEAQLWGGPVGAADIGIFAPSDDKTELIYGRVADAFCSRNLLGPGAVVRWRDAPGSRRIELAWGARIVAFSLAKGLPAEGWGFRMVVVDEAQNLDWEVWSKSIRPALADKGGRALFVGTALGSGFGRLRQLAEEQPADWGIHSFPTSANPAIPPEEIEAARRELPDRLFREQFMAEWQPESARVFDLSHCLVEDYAPSDPAPGVLAVDGWDLARRVDETVGITLNVTAEPWRLAEWYGGTREPWPSQCRRIEARFQRWKSGRVTIDATGIGDVVYEHLAIPTDVLEPYVFTLPSKQRLLWNLQAMLETHRLVLPQIPRLLRQLSEYSWDDTGLDTDWVMALALAAWAGRAVRLMPVEVFMIG